MIVSPALSTLLELVRDEKGQLLLSNDEDGWLVLVILRDYRAVCVHKSLSEAALRVFANLNTQKGKPHA